MLCQTWILNLCAIKMINVMRRTLHEPCHDSRGLLKKIKYNKIFLFFYFWKKKGGNIHGIYGWET